MSAHDTQKLLQKLFRKSFTKGLILGLIGALAIAGIVSVIVPTFLPTLWHINWSMNGILPNSAASFNFDSPVKTSFGTYIPETIEYTPSIKPIAIKSGLSNVNFQGLNPPEEAKATLEKYGFALVDDGEVNIYGYYNDTSIPQFITTDLCLHAFHNLFDMSLRILEGVHFAQDFYQMLNGLRTAQLNRYNTVTDPLLKDALNKNVAYLSVMMYLLDNSTSIPDQVSNLVNAELTNIENGERANSAIFTYKEDFTQYKPRGHYTRNAILSDYFQAMMYAGRMGFLLNDTFVKEGTALQQTRMAILLTLSLNDTIGEKQIWDYWKAIYEPTVFYVGKSDDLTPEEYYQIWKEIGSPTLNELADNATVQSFIERAQEYRPPKINSMFVSDVFDYTSATKGFRLMGQRFIPDSFIFQQLVHTNVANRLMPTGLDVMSVFGSARADYFMENESEIYPDYDDQVAKLREWFGNLTEYDWTQNLYWLWLYSLFPLFEAPTKGYPGFMLNTAWLDKALMTAMGSWAELRHDTILYAKQSYTLERGLPEVYKGYVEPYPELYLRLKALTLMAKDGLNNYGLLSSDFAFRLEGLANIFGKLAEISIKELEDTGLSEDEYNYINTVGLDISYYSSFDDPKYEQWTNGADKRMAIVADVHTDPNSGKVLEVATGNPYTIYVVVQHGDKLYLTKGATFSYYEFTQPMTDRLTDEEWQEILDTNPPEIPLWQTFDLPIIHAAPALELASIEAKRPES
ncbi:MAG: DUF3160 domain-containing protein [Candidatus Heimdallarchaeaceae archaeon]